MKLIFVRHGEAQDDLENRFGGWYDPDLSPAGVQGAEKLAVDFKSRGVVADLVLTSPLKRAVQTAGPIAQVLGIPMETDVYLKERNTYGLLCGENKDEAKIRYPELVTAYENGEEVWGYEPVEFLLGRMRILLDKLGQRQEKSLICVTHGVFLKNLFKEFLQKEVVKLHDNCWAEMELNNGQLQLLRTEGIEFT